MCFARAASRRRATRACARYVCVLARAPCACAYACTVYLHVRVHAYVSYVCLPKGV